MTVLSHAQNHRNIGLKVFGGARAETRAGRYSAKAADHAAKPWLHGTSPFARSVEAVEVGLSGMGAFYSRPTDRMWLRWRVLRLLWTIWRTLLLPIHD